MASFPTSVKTFATRTSGQTIDPAHVNDLQDEVNAIEAGYLNATARLNSSNSTLANLSVTGGSTFAGGLNSSNSTLAALSVTGGSTLASSITIGTIPYIFPSSGGSTGNVLTIVSTSGSTVSLEFRAAAATDVPAVLVSLGPDNVVVTDATGTVLNWLTNEYISTSTMHSTATNSSRLTPPSSGLYWVSAQIVALSYSSIGYRQVSIRNDLGGEPLIVRVDAIRDGANEPRFQLGGLVSLTSTQWITCRYFHTQGANSSLYADASGCQFGMFRVR